MSQADKMFEELGYKLKEGAIPKEKIKEIIYPTPENYVPIEVQTSDMYSKLQELLEK